MARRRRSGSSVNSSAKRHVPTMARRSQATSPNVIHFVRDGGGIPDSSAAAWHNQAALNASLHALGAGMTLHIPPGTFHVMGGVEGVGLRDVTVRIDGTLRFSPDTRAWPRYTDGIMPRAGLAFWEAAGLTLTSGARQGVLDGNGRAWWSVPGIGYLIHQEWRPRLLTVANSSDILVEKLLLADSPYWTTLFANVDNLVIRHCGITARRTSGMRHSLIDLTAFNTDGFDVAGRNVHIHDCDIWSQDDAIAVKDYIADDYPGDVPPANRSGLPIAVPSENMLIERINASGLGLTIGSIGEGIVRNITFRDCYLRNTVKGLYLKFRRGRNHTGDIGRISDVTYERVVLDAPEQWPIWIGPAQQADARNPCLANPCSLCWPMLPPALSGATCTGSLTGAYERIAMRDISIYSPRHSPGVLLADPSLPMADVTFHNVVVHPECGAASRLSADGFKVAFSRLPLVVRPDANVVIFYLLLGAGALAAVMFCACIAARGGARVRSAIAGLLALLAALCAHVSIVSGGLRDESKYYACEGVVGGVATGKTWPVPPCFRDATRHAAAGVPCVGGPLATDAAQWAVISVALLLGAACCCCRRRDGLVSRVGSFVYEPLS